MGIEAKPEVKFAIINEALKSNDNLLSVKYMCEYAGVSRSGFYNWQSSENIRKKKEEQDRKDFEIILEAYSYRGYAKGARGIYMRMLHMTPPVIMNLKKIRRLMKKYGLICPIRKLNPYRQMAKALKTSNVAPNFVARDFKSRGPRKTLLTDITYISYKNGKCYLSTVLDSMTHQVLSYMLSTNLQVDFVLDTIKELKLKHGSTLDDCVYVHSDQGCHYTSKAFVELLHDYEFIQSMSRKGNCWDNAPQESFFGHMKDEIANILSTYETYEEVVTRVDDWIDYYNKDRYQWELLLLSPDEYYNYLITGCYPIRKGKSKKRE